MGVLISAARGQHDAPAPRSRKPLRVYLLDKTDPPVALHAIFVCDAERVPLDGAAMREAPRFHAEVQQGPPASTAWRTVSVSPTEFPFLTLPRILNDTASQDLDAHIAKLTAVTCNRAASPMRVNTVPRPPATPELVMQRVLSKSTSNGSVSANQLLAPRAQPLERAKSAADEAPALGGLRAGSGKAVRIGVIATPPQRNFTSVKDVDASSNLPASRQRLSSNLDWLTRSASSAEGGGESVFYARISPHLKQASNEMLTHLGNIRVLYRSWDELSAQHWGFVAELAEVLTREHPHLLQAFGAESLLDASSDMVNTINNALLLIFKPDELIQTLMEVGAQHRRYNIHEADFVAIKDVFMSILPKYLSADLQDKCRVAWEPHWRAVIELMMHGFTSARGDWYAAQHRTVQLTEARRVLGDIVMQLQLADRVAFVQQMVDAAIASDELMERLTALRDRRVAISAFHGLVRFLRACDDPDSVGALMDELLPIYYPLGLDAAAVRALRQPFIDTCKKAVQRARQLDHWSPRTSQSLGVLWDLLTETWEKTIERSEKMRVKQTDRAPNGSESFCLLFTDIEDSARLWERSPAEMASAAVAYQSAVRALISEFGAYEVKTVGDSFVIAAKDVLIALKVALSIQQKFMEVPMAKDLEIVRNPQGDGPPDCWRRESLRVRVGIHYCRDATAVYDSVHQRYDYYGPSVNVAARALAAAKGGQILMTREATAALQAMPEFTSSRSGLAATVKVMEAPEDAQCATVASEDLLGSRPLADLITVRDWGQHSFKGTKHGAQLFSVQPKEVPAQTLLSAAASVPLLHRLPSSAPTGAVLPQRLADTADGAASCCGVSERDMLFVL